MMKPPAIRVTAVPRTEHPNSGLQAMHFADRFGDEVWAIPWEGAYLGDGRRVHFGPFDSIAMERLFGPYFRRRMTVLWVFFRMLVRPRRFYFIHSFIFAVPAWLLRRRYCIFIHGSDHRYLQKSWGRVVARGATEVFGVGFGRSEPGLTVTEVPNIFIPADPATDAEMHYDFLFVLRNAPVKNPVYPIELADHLGKKLNLAIAVAGLGPGELAQADRERLEALQNAGCKIEYVGRRPYEDVVELMKVSRTLMIPSFSEGLPKALLEAMSFGMHVVANERLTFPAPLCERVEYVGLEDWKALTELVDRERKSPRSEGNQLVAAEYLRQSQQVLIALYETVYKRELGFVPGPQRLAPA